VKEQRDEVEANLAQELNKFRILYDVALAMTAERSLDENLLLLATKSRELLRGDTAYIALRDNQAGDVYMHTFCGIRTESFKRIRLPFGAGLGGKVAAMGTGCIVEDYFREIEPVVHDQVREEDLVSGVAAPLQINKTNLGVIYVFNRTRTKFTKSDLDTLCLLGNLAAFEITRKRAEAELRQARCELEKRVEHRTEELKTANAKLRLEIEERKKIEKALLESEQRFRELAQLLPQPVFELDDKGTVTFISLKARDLFGYSEDEFAKGFKIVDIIAPHDRRKCRESIKMILNDEDQGPNQCTGMRKDGTTFPMIVHTSCIMRAGRSVGVRGIMVDITEYERTEQALRESEDKYRRVVENANDAILVIQNGMLKLLNPKAREIFGFTEEAPTASFFKYIHPEDRDMVLQRYRKRLIGQPAPSRYSFRIIDRDGNVRWVEVSAVLINWEGTPATFNFLSDITERRRIEEDLLKVEKLQSVSLLAGGIAHDFNNILAAILGNISLAKVYSKPTDKAFERLKQAEKACIRAQGLTQQLLTFSKGGAPVKEVTNISKLVKECCLFALRGSNVRCAFDFTNDLWPVDVDQGQFSQVIDNLVINASHAMADGGLIEVKARNVVVSSEDGLQLEPGSYVRISLKDHGVGISKEHLPKIFDPYFTTKKTGSGLGLATSYAVVKRHGGIITVESEMGVGSTFHLYLSASEKTIDDEPDSDKQPALGGGRILLMDDEEVIRDLGQELLTMLGYEVVVAKDGQEAVDLYRRAHNSPHPFDAIIADLTVPGGMGGSEAVRILREFEPNLRAIVSSGYSNDPIMADYKSYGFDEVVAKPYTVTELSETLIKIMGPRTTGGGKES
jgi:PAS domain S-box-containing protein